MADIYKGSYITTAAASSSSDRTGFLGPRATDIVHPLPHKDDIADLLFS